jgi:hypothetical protein
VVVVVAVAASGTQFFAHHEHDDASSIELCQAALKTKQSKKEARTKAEDSLASTGRVFFVFHLDRHRSLARGLDCEERAVTTNCRRRLSFCIQQFAKEDLTE